MSFREVEISLVVMKEKLAGDILNGDKVKGLEKNGEMEFLQM